MKVLLAALVVFILLVVSEVWWRRQNARGEFTRKFVHITVGTFVAFWPYFLSPNDIKLFSVAFLTVAALSKYLHVFRAIHSVQRPTWGEFWFALVVGIMAFDLSHPHIFTAALLEMSLADGLAAVIGTRYGNRYRYSVLGSPKSITGTLTFFIVSCLVLAGYGIWTPALHHVALLLPIALGATILENVAARGLDNLLVPVFTAVCLSLLS